MTSPAPVDVKGQGKARGRRRPQADGAAGDASGPPQSRPDAPDEEAASEAAPVGAPRPGDAPSAVPDAAHPEAPAVEPERPVDPDATGRWDVIDAEDDDLERSVPGSPDEPASPAGASRVNPPAGARLTARQRRAQEHADQAAEIEAAALAESTGRSRRQRDREQPVVASRRSRRQQQALERMATKAAEAAAGDGLPVEEESRRERRQHKRAAKADDQARRSRRDRKPRKRRAQPADGSGAAPVAEPAAAPVAEPEAEPAADLAPEARDRRPPTSGTDGGDQVGEPTPTPGGPTVTGALTAAAAASAAASASARAREPEPVPRPPTPEARERTEPAVERRPDKEVEGEQAPALAAKLREGARWLDKVGGVVPPGPTPSGRGAPARPKRPADEETPAVRGTPAVRRPPARTARPSPGPKSARESARPAGAPPSGTRPAPDRRRPPSAKQVPRAVVLRQRRRRRRTIIGTTVLLVVVNLLVGSAYVYFQWRLDQINRVAVAGLAEDAPGEVMNVLLVGSDSREGLEGIDAAQAGQGEIGGQRSDTIMVLHVDPRQQRAAILAVPRDLYVPIPGTGGSDRVNAAFAIGGAERLIAALSGIGVQVNHYAEVDFVGFKEIVDAIGGVPVFVPAPSRDASSGLAIGPGCINFDGTLALAYVRSRELESLVDGQWVTDPRGDLGRIERQQDFIRRVMKKGVSAGVSNPFALNRLIGIGVRNLTVDETMSTSDIASLARRFRSVDPESVETLVLPTTPQTIDGKDVLVLADQEAQDEIAKINGAIPLSAEPQSPTTNPPALQPGDVRVRVLNANGQRGLATTAADTLKAVGFQVVGTGDQTALPRTVVRHGPGGEAVAKGFADSLQAGGQLQSDPALGSADIVLVLGTDYKGFKNPSAPAAGQAAPVTTAPTVPDPAASC